MSRASKPLNDILAAIASAEASDVFTTSDSLRISVKRFGAVGDGATDDTAALQSAFNSGVPVFIPPGVYLTSATLTIPAGGDVEGSGGGSYLVLGPVAETTVIQKTNGNVGGASAIVLGGKSSLRRVMVRPSNFEAVSYDAANYPGETGNTSTGIEVGTGAVLEDVGVRAFAVENVKVTGPTFRLSRCFSWASPIGYNLTAGDGWVTECVAMFCHNAGIRNASNYNGIRGCRIEWNARYGINTVAGEFVVTSNIFDRNGWAGIVVNSQWGGTITGNYFARNGVGGDGIKGRWGYSVPGHPSYVETANALSCHIEIEYQRDVIISGNRYRSGSDDAGDGCNGPGHIYCMTGAPGASTYVSIFGNAGEQAAAGGYGGYVSAFEGGGSVFSGGDTTAQRIGIASPVPVQFGNAVAGVGFYGSNNLAGLGQVGSLVIEVPKNVSGTIYLRASVFLGAYYGQVHFASDGIDTPAACVIEDKVGAGVITAALMEASATPGMNKVTLTFLDNYFVQYNVVGTSL